MYRLVLLAPLTAALLGAAPLPDAVPLGTFSTWLGVDRKPLHIVSGGVAVSVEALPCSTNTNTESTCYFEGYNNQAAITVTAPGLPPFRTISSDQAMYVRVAVTWVDRRDPRPGVVIDNQSGGSGGDTRVEVLQPRGEGYSSIPLTARNATSRDGRMVQGEIADGVGDLTGDGRIDLVLRDPAFDSTFGCNACTPRPPMVLSIVDGHAVDLSADPSARPVFARDMIARRAGCRSHHDRNGECAAYVADTARLGRFAAGWRDMLTHYDRQDQLPVPQGCTAPRQTDGRCPAGEQTRYSSFPESLRAFLVTAGYITAAEAAAAPLR